MTYVDALHIYGISRAGYTPQLMSLRLPNPEVILELLAQSGGQALIHDASFSDVLREKSFPTHVAVDARNIAAPNVDLPPIMEGTCSEKPVMIFHTSGSTSGQPKVIRCSYSWWDACLKKSRECVVPKNPARQDVTTWMLVPFHYYHRVPITHLDHSPGAACATLGKLSCFPALSSMLLALSKHPPNHSHPLS